MLLIAGLLMIGTVLIAAELFVPGGILGIVGGVTILAACYLSYLAYGVLGAGAVFVGSIVFVTTMIYFEFKLLKKTKLGQHLFLDAASGEGSLRERGETLPKALIGKRGETLTTLAPSGKILLEGTTYVAYSQNGLLQKGHTVEVVGRDAMRLVVKSV